METSQNIGRTKGVTGGVPEVRSSDLEGMIGHLIAKRNDWSD